jgi:propanol-preferring alcohol dehydrogenase
MRALRLLSWKSTPELVEVPKPTPGPGEVVVRIGGSGACHSDLHLMHDFDASAGLPWGPPFTLGHENAGWVDSVGEGVTSVTEGQAVAVYGPWGCGDCPRCRLGIETYCENPLGAPVPGGGGGLGMDGGMADYMLVPDARQVLVLPDGLDPAHAAPLTDAGLTPYHAVRRSWAKLPPEAVAVVIGVGGLGHMGVQALKATTAATIIAVDARPEALALATAMGADHVIAASDTAADQIRALTGGKGADVVLDFVGSDPTIALGAAVVRQLGDLTVVGIGGGSLSFSFFSVPYEASLQTTYWGSRPELGEVLLLGSRGLLTPRVTIYSLDDAAQAYVDMQDGKIEGRAVIVP